MIVLPMAKPICLPPFFGATCLTLSLWLGYDLSNLFSNDYRRFIAGPTLNNSKKKVEFFGFYHLVLLSYFFGFFWKLTLNVVENVAKVDFFSFFLFLAECHFSTLINYSTNMC